MKILGSLIGEAKGMIVYEVNNTGMHVVIEPSEIEKIREFRERTKNDVEDDYLIEYYELVTDDNKNYYKSDMKSKIKFKELKPVPVGP